MDIRPEAVDTRRCPRRGAAVIAAALATLLAASGAAAQPDPDGVNRPEGARRITRLFSFEEPQNPHPVPDGWERAIDNPRGNFRRPGFPAHNEPAFDFTVGAPGAAGTTSILLSTRGGSTALRLQPGEVGVFVDADYAVTASVRTDGLRHARAFLTARFLDQQLRPIPGSETRSDPAPPDSAGAWVELSAALGRAVPGAAWLQIDLELLQPDQYLPPDPRLGKHEIRREDVSGGAWFDDVIVLQVPRVRLGTYPAGNSVVAPEQVTLEAVVRDLGGDLLTARMRVRDVDGTVVDSTSAPADPGGKPLRWSPRLHAYGWYMAELDIEASGRVVSRTHSPFVWLAPGAGTPLVERRRFGFVIDNVMPTDEGLIADAAERIRTGFVVLPAWDARLLSKDIPATVLPRRAPIEKLLRAGQEITVCLPGAPPDVAAAHAIDPAEMGELARHAPGQWFEPLATLLDLFGQRLLRYQIGPTGTDAWFWDSDPAGALQLYRDRLAKVIPGPAIGVPWRAETEPSGPLFDPASPPRGRADLVTLTVPVGFDPQHGMQALGQTWTGGQDAPELTAVLELPDPQIYGADAAVTDFARRALNFWSVFASSDDAAAHPARLAIAQPWKKSTQNDGVLLPSPLLPVFRELVTRLDGRRVVGEFPAHPGVRCLILAARRPDGEMTRGALAAWNRSAAHDDAFIDVTALGSDLRVYDLFGNLLDQRVEHVAERSIIRLDETPVFIEGAEPYLALFAAGARIEPGFLRAVATEHEGAIVLSNPWPMRITGQVQVKDADEAARRRTDWTFWPQGVVDFAAGPGEVIRIPLTISFGASQIAGVKDLWLVARVQADREYPPIRLRSPVEIGLQDLDLQTEIVLTPHLDGPDVVAVATITNKGRRTRALRLEAAAWGFPSHQLSLSNLTPGQTASRRFLFKGGAASLKGRRIVISVADTEEAERLNKAVVVP